MLEFSSPGFNEHDEANKSKRTGSILDELAPEFAGRVVMLRVPVDTSPATAQNYNVTVTPTVIFLKSGKKIEEAADFHLKSWFRAKLNELLSLKE
ncbi:thioredoxin family protein [Pseudomonas syringae]|uniref:thioredoxin family protein n=1 Tax=Pseudomonas syringae TaxID=317 RepID=UPI00287B801F|nr:thioredoxin family protein [Pseudomonas syringae]